MKLTNQTILITGGTSGIGLHLAIKLHNSHNKVIICGRRQAELDKIASQYPGIDTLLCDVSDAAQREALAAQVTSKYPQLNILINNAGIMQLFDLTQPVDVAKVTAEVTTNIVAPIHLGSLFVQHLQQQQTAAIVNVTSGLAFTPYAVAPVYSATKAAMHSYTVCLRHQLRTTSVKVFEIIPPAVDSSLGSADGYEQAKDTAMNMDEFVGEVVKVIEADKYETGIGIAQHLHEQRDALFNMVNQ